MSSINLETNKLKYLNHHRVSQLKSVINLHIAAGARRVGSFFRQLFLPPFLSFNCPLTHLNIPNVDDLVLGKVVANNDGQ